MQCALKRSGNLSVPPGKGEGDPRRDRYYIMGGRFFVLTRYTDAFTSFQRGLGFAGSDDSEDHGEEEEPLPMSVICYAMPE